eukprot:4823684-Amphidinium_carterae.1
MSQPRQPQPRTLKPATAEALYHAAPVEPLRLSGPREAGQDRKNILRCGFNMSANHRVADVQPYRQLVQVQCWTCTNCMDMMHMLMRNCCSRPL